MAGHSKWANIKHKKGAQDVKRSKVFQKITKEMMVAIKEGGNSVDTNSKLRLVIDKAKSANMPNDNINRILTRSEKDNSNWNQMTYEGYGPGGVAIIINCLTDNVNRTSSSIKSTFTKGGGNLGTNGSVSYLFENKGILVLDSSIYEFDKVMEIVLEAGADDFNLIDNSYEVLTTPSNLSRVIEALNSKGIEMLNAEGAIVRRDRYPLLHQQPFFTERGSDPDALPVTQEINNHIIALPTFPGDDGSLVDQYIEAFKKVVSSF